MEQAYSHFNSGKYKDAYNLLAASNLNIDSYQPNLAICEYLSNRCLQSSVTCHKKLNDWLMKKFKRENYKLDHQTESIVKLNIAILLILLGKRDNALLVMTDIYKNRACFVEFMQSRILLLLMELNINLRNSTSVLTLYKKYPLKPSECSRNPSSQWISLILHEHNKSSTVCKQQFMFMSNIFINQALMQLSISDQFLSSKQGDKQLKQQLIDRITKRKNGINKYYEINIRMISHFHEAQREFHSNNYVKSLYLMNFANIQNQYENMPSTKIITNILNALTTSNVGNVHFAQKKFHISLSYFSKAKGLLAKGCTGVQDKDLQHFSINYANHNEAISYNMALSLLAAKSREAYSVFESIKKSNPNTQDFKWWYRVGQSILEYYHASDFSKLGSHRTTELLQQAETCFTCAINLIEKNQFPSHSLLENIVPGISQDQIDVAEMKFQAQKRQFKKSIIVILCYLYNSLGKYSNTIQLGSSILKDNLRRPDRINIMHYMVQAYNALSEGQNEVKMQQIWQNLKKQTNSIKDIQVQTIYTKDFFDIHTFTYDDLFIYQYALHLIHEGSPIQAAPLVQDLRLKGGSHPSPVLRILLKYLHIEMGLQKRYIDPYLK